MPRNSKHFFKSLFSSRIFLFFIALSLIWLGVNVGRESYRKYQLQKDVNSLKSEVANLEEGNQNLASLIDFYQQESYLEKEARLKLNLKQPGETVVIVPGSNEAPTSEEQLKSEIDEFIGQEKEDKKESRLWQWWEYFFGDSQ